MQEDNQARKGGAVAFMALVHNQNLSAVFIRGNRASENGGGIYGFSNLAELILDQASSLVVESNAAGQDGGGIAVAEGALLSVSFPACAADCTGAMRGNGICDLQCMTAGCNW